MKVKFYGIDEWGRPVFKAERTKIFVGSVKYLFNYNATKEEVTEFFKDKLDELVYFGCSFNCEPDGTKMNCEIEIMK